MVYQILWTILSLVIVVALAYYILKILRMKGIGSISNKNVNIIDVVQIGQDKRLYIVEAAGRCFMLGVTNSNINYICDLDKEKLNRKSDDV